MADWIQADWPLTGRLVAGTTLRSCGDGPLPLAGRPALLTQVHGNKVIEAGVADQPEADASYSRDANVICVVRTADCLPVLISNANGTAVAAAHAGWRGLAAGVLENTVAALGEAPDSLVAWLGPAISQVAFEVGDEVREAFVTQDGEARNAFVRNERGRWQADLYRLARQRLAAAGLRSAFGGGLCTYTDNVRFFSYRRNPDCGRMLSFIAPVGAR